MIYFRAGAGLGHSATGSSTFQQGSGGFLSEYIGEGELESLIDYADKIFLKYGAPAELHGTDEEEIKRLEEVSARNGLKLVPFKIRHLGTDRCFSLLKNLRQEINTKIDIQFNAEAVEILKQGDKVTGVRTGDGREFSADFIILAPGRSGSHWLSEESKRLGLST